MSTPDAMPYPVAHLAWMILANNLDAVTKVRWENVVATLQLFFSHKETASLQTAAPDLLVALELAVHILEAEVERTRDAMERYPDDPNGPGALADDEKILSLARAAIAKARGQ